MLAAQEFRIRRHPSGIFYVWQAEGGQERIGSKSVDPETAEESAAWESCRVSLAGCGHPDPERAAWAWVNRHRAIDLSGHRCRFGSSRQTAASRLGLHTCHRRHVPGARTTLDATGLILHACHRRHVPGAWTRLILGKARRGFGHPDQRQRSDRQTNSPATQPKSGDGHCRMVSPSPLAICRARRIADV